MGFKWTYAFLCIMGTANLFVETIPAPESVARMRESRAFEAVKSASQISSRNKRDVNTLVDDNGNRAGNAKPTNGNGRSFSYSGTFDSGTGVSSSSSSGGGNAFGLATSRIGGGGPPSGSFGNSFGYSGNPWQGSGAASGIPQNYIGGGGNQNYPPNVGFNTNQYSRPYGTGYGLSFQDFIQQYFRAIEAQNQAMQAQFLQPQPGARSGSYSWANGGAFMTGLNGRIDPTARSYSYASTFRPTRPPLKYFIGRHQPAAVQTPYNAANLGSRNENRFNSFGFNNGGGFGNGFGSGFDGFGGGFNPGVSRGAFDEQEPSFPTGSNSAFASSVIGPNGGFQHAEINPAAPGIVSRIFEPHPPSSGNSVATFSSSSSSTVVDSDGKVMNKKSATSVIDDNGKITVHTVKDP